MNIPRLYKYRCFDEPPVTRHQSNEQVPQWQQTLYDGMVFFANPETFNDPYDCDFVVESSFLQEKAMQELYIEVATQTLNLTLTEEDKQLLRTTKNIKDALKSIWKVPLPDDFESNLMKRANETFQELKRHLRVACFSETNNSILMWSHYAENHTGFCIEYDFNKSGLRNHLHRVRYSENRKYVPGSFADLDGKMASEIILETTLCKAKEWSYEKEWRCILRQGNLNSDPLEEAGPCVANMQNCISAIYLGAKAVDKYCTQICDHYERTNVKVYQMQLQPDCYKLNAKLIL